MQRMKYSLERRSSYLAQDFFVKETITSILSEATDLRCPPLT